MDCLKRYLRGRGSPLGDMVIADTPQDLNPISWARAFLISTTGSEYLPVDRDKRIRVSFVSYVICDSETYYLLGQLRDALIPPSGSACCTCFYFLFCACTDSAH